MTFTTPLMRTMIYLGLALSLFLFDSDGFIINRASSVLPRKLYSTIEKAPRSATGSPHFFDYLKFDANPTFDVMKKTLDYVGARGKVRHEQGTKDYRPL